MIGKKLADRFTLGLLPAERAVAVVTEVLASHGAPLVEVRAKDARMIACAVVRADKLVVKQCRALGLDVKPGATAVFGLLGADAARLFAQLGDAERAWLETPCGPRETKVLLLAGGFALLSVEADRGKVSITPLARAPLTGTSSS
jgi:hypothetical protein